MWKKPLRRNKDTKAGLKIFSKTGMEGNMLMKTYLWIEDRKEKSGYIFWQTFMEQLCPEIAVESKKNNSELVKAVKA